MKRALIVVVGWIFSTSSLVQYCGAQATSPPVVMLHQRLSSTCELAQSGVLRDEDKYVLIVISGTGEEVYSPELAGNDFLEYSGEVPASLVEKARSSSFRVKQVKDNSAPMSDHVLSTTKDGACPDLQDAVKTAKQERADRSRGLRSKLFHLGVKGVTPPESISTPQPSDSLSKEIDSSSKEAPLSPKSKMIGEVFLAAIVGSDGTVPQVKVLQSSSEPNLDAKAIEAVKAWKFKPARKEGFPVTVLMNFQIDFHK